MLTPWHSVQDWGFAWFLLSYHLSYILVCPLIFILILNLIFFFVKFIVQDGHLFSTVLTLQMSTHNFSSLQLYSPMSAFKISHSLNLYKIWPIQTDRQTDRQTDHPTYRTTEAPPELKKCCKLPAYLINVKSCEDQICCPQTKAWSQMVLSLSTRYLIPC